MRLFRTPDFRRPFIERHKGSKMLDLGCGPNKTPGSVGIDHFPFPGVDLVHDLDRFPYPFEDASWDAVILNHVIEHLDDIPGAIREIRRILKTGGDLWVATPHFSDCSSYSDPTHRFHLGLESLLPFCRPPNHWFDMEHAYVAIIGRWRDIGYEYLINRRPEKNAISPRAHHWEERHCFQRRGREMTFILRKVQEAS